VLNNPIALIDPDGRSGVGVFFPKYKASWNGRRMPFTGHAGVLMINDNTGFTRYFEFGRYGGNSNGVIRSYSVSNVEIDSNGLPTPDSLTNVLREIHNRSGGGGVIEAGYFGDADFDAMLDFATNAAADKDREPYSIFDNNCATFTRQTLEAGGANLPGGLIPSPYAYGDNLKGNADIGLTDNIEKNKVRVINSEVVRVDGKLQFIPRQ
jgi:hypothetical protein